MKLNSYTAEIDNKKVTFKAGSEPLFEDSEKVLFDECPKEIQSLDWIKQYGYTSFKVFDEAEHDILRNIVKELLLKIFLELNIQVPKLWDLEDYHKIVKDDNTHEKVISITREFNPKDFNIVNVICNAFSKKFAVNFAENPNIIDEYGHELLIIRINRPDSNDINPPHRDGDLVKWKDCINMWYSLSGNPSLSTLPLIPNSHYMKEKDIIKLPEDSIFEGKKYTVNTIVGTANGLKFIRPKLDKGNILSFSPYVIHGLAYNNGNTTRMSFELRPMVKKET